MKLLGIDVTKRGLAPPIGKALAGAKMIIARGSEFVFRLVPIKRHKGRRKLGILKGKPVVGSEFFEPLPPDELDLWS